MTISFFNNEIDFKHPFIARLASIFIVIVLICIPKNALATSNEYDLSGAASYTLTGYDIDTHEFGNLGLAGYLIRSGKSEDEIRTITEPIQNKVYDLVREASRYYDAVENNGGNIETDGFGGFEVLKWSDGVSFNNNQQNFDNYIKYLEAQSALFRKLFEINQQYPNSLPLSNSEILKVLGSNYGILQAAAAGTINKGTDGDENFDGSGIEFATGKEWYDPDTNIGYDVLPPDIALAVANSNSIPQKEKDNIAAAQGVQCYKGGLELDIPGCLAIASYYVFLKGGALVLGLIGMLFNMSLNFTLNIGTLFWDRSFGLGGTGGSIYIGWSTIRNFINVLFIFVLLYVAISTIIQNSSYGAKKMLTKIITAALILNFSLFFTKAIIDFSNIIALQFYANILKSADEVDGAAKQNDISTDNGLSSAILNSIGMNTLWGSAVANPKPITEANANEFSREHGLNEYNLLTISIFGGIFMLILSFVFFMAIVQFLMRTIVLLFLMVTSPIGFIGEAIPALGNVAKEWRKRLTNNVVFAPAYMAILYVVCQIMFGSAQSIVGESTFSGALIGDTGSRVNQMGIVFWFFLVIGLLLTGQGAARVFADKFGGKFTGLAENAFKGGFGARKAGTWAAGKTWSGTKTSAKYAGGYIAEGGRRILDKTGLSKFVPRKTRDAWYQAGVDRAKKKANNLRRKDNESDESYGGRQAEIVFGARKRQVRSMGLDVHNDFDTTQISYTDHKGNAQTTYKVGQLKSATAQRLKNEAQSKFNFAGNRRKRSLSAVDRIEQSFGGPKAGTSDYFKDALKKAESDLKAVVDDPVYKALLAQLEGAENNARQIIENHVRAGTTPSRREFDAAKSSRAAKEKHKATADRLMSKVEELKEKLERAKRDERDKEDKKKK